LSETGLHLLFRTILRVSRATSFPVSQPLGASWQCIPHASSPFACPSSKSSAHPRDTKVRSPPYSRWRSSRSRPQDQPDRPACLYSGRRSFPADNQTVLYALHYLLRTTHGRACSLSRAKMCARGYGLLELGGSVWRTHSCTRSPALVVMYHHALHRVRIAAMGSMRR